MENAFTFGGWNQGVTVPTRYCDTLIEIERVDSEKRLGFLRSRILLLDENSRPLSAMAMQNHIETLH
ncbi:hypothetical protein TNCV_3675541 [Trichonephila clavipes]|nr:hypothetical protein TNCV_3675541 [Trichonephila clavipes]